MKRITVFVSGKVQEVGYRERVVTIAKVFMLTGMVQNLEDGRVKIVAEGEEGKLKLFIDAINIKNTMIFVENMDIAYSNVTGDYNNFYKLVGVGETDSRLDTASRYLKELIGVVSNGFNGMNSKMNIMIDKQNQMLDKQNQMLDKQNQMIEKQTETISTIKNESKLMLDKQNQMLDKQNQMLDKQNQMLDKQNQMIEKQTETISTIKNESKLMLDKQNQMIEKQTETISTIQNESKLIRKEIGGEIHLFNVDSRDHMELNYRDIKEETKEIKEDIKDVKEEIENIKISLKK